MRQKFARFMQGRYGERGADEFSRFLLRVGLICILLSIFSKHPIWSWLVMALLVYTYYRLFSRNFYKRYEENQKYLLIRNKVKYKLSGLKTKTPQDKTHRIYSCPSCGQKIRVPRGKGKIIVTCPKCRTEFQKRS